MIEPALVALIFSTSVPAESATSAIILTRPWNRSLRATKSVSELTSTTTPLVPCTLHADQAFGRDAAGFLGGLRQALLAQPILRRLHVAVGLGERALAIHHAGAGQLAQFLDHLGGDICHRIFPSIGHARPWTGHPRLIALPNESWVAGTKPAMTTCLFGFRRQFFRLRDPASDAAGKTRLLRRYCARPFR